MGEQAFVRECTSVIAILHLTIIPFKLLRCLATALPQTFNCFLMFMRILKFFHTLTYTIFSKDDLLLSANAKNFMGIH